MRGARAGVHWRAARGTGRLVLLYGRGAREIDGAEGPRQVRGPQRSRLGRPYAGANERRRVALQDSQILSGLAFFKIAKLTNFEYNSKISKYGSCRATIGLHLLQRAT
jgi:hypothetical protein